MADRTLWTACLFALFVSAAATFGCSADVDATGFEEASDGDDAAMAEAASRLVAAEAKAERPIGDTRVLTRIPAEPGYPEGIVVDKNSAFVVCPATIGTIGTGPSEILQYNTRSGAFVRRFVLEGENVLQEHAASAVAFDAEGRLYALGTQIGVVRLEVATGEQEAYASLLPDLPSCALAGPPCSPALEDRPPFPNDMVFDDEGYLYVTDSWQATVFRIAPGGGAPEIWYQDARLDSVFGPNGIRFDPSRRLAYLTVSGPTSGGVYSIPLVEAPSPSDLVKIRDFGADTPDGMAVGEDGLLYVALALANQISILEPNGTEIHRFPDRVQNQLRPIPYSNPSGIAFNGRGSILVTNHAIFDPLANLRFAIFDVWADDAGDPLSRPRVP